MAASLVSPAQLIFFNLGSMQCHTRFEVYFKSQMPAWFNFSKTFLNQVILESWVLLLESWFLSDFFQKLSVMFFWKVGKIWAYRQTRFCAIFTFSAYCAKFAKFVGMPQPIFPTRHNLKTSVKFFWKVGKTKYTFKW